MSPTPAEGLMIVRRPLAVVVSVALAKDRPGVQGAPIATGTTQRVTTTAGAAGLPAAPAYRVRDLRAHSDRETAGTCS